MQTVSTQSFLSRFATPRIAGEVIPGAYSEELKMWAIETEAGLRPIITSDASLAELTTKTKVNQESDDDLVTMVEMQTKTASRPEQDDEVRLAGSALLEVTTKTDAQLERDDTSPNILGFL